MEYLGRTWADRIIVEIIAEARELVKPKDAKTMVGRHISSIIKVHLNSFGIREQDKLRCWTLDIGVLRSISFQSLDCSCLLVMDQEVHRSSH